MNKQFIETKQKKTEKRRLIAKYISIACLAGMFSFGGSAIAIQHTINKDVKDLENKQLDIISQFTNSAEFKQEQQLAINALVDNYTTNKLTYEEFEKELNYLNSIDYADLLFPEIASTNLKEQMKQSNSKIYDLEVKSNRSHAANALALGYMVSAGGYIVSSAIRDLHEK